MTSKAFINGCKAAAILAASIAAAVTTVLSALPSIHKDVHQAAQNEWPKQVSQHLQDLLTMEVTNRAYLQGEIDTLKAQK